MKTITLNELTKKLGSFQSVKNAPSRNGEGQAPNQFIIYFEHGEVLQSYNSLIGAKINGQLYLTDHHDYSTTTGRFCGAWCGLKCRERRHGIDNEEIIFITNTK